MAKKSCKKGYYYCYSSKKCKRIPMGYYIGGGGWLRKEEEKSEDTETKKNGNGNGANGNGNGNGGSNGGSNGGGVSEAWSAKYKKSIDCDNPKGFSQRAHCRGRKKVNEATMSPAQKRKDTMLKKKYDKSDMKQNMIDQYGKEEGTKIYFATIRKQAMKEELDSKDKPFVKKLVGKLRKGSKTHAKQADDLEKAMNEESNPRIPRKEGQPANSKKHSDLYTDENPKGTIHGLGFKDVATAKASVAKIKKSSRSHAHKIQAAIAMEQRARVMGKTSEAAVFRKFINSMKKKTKQMNEAKGGDHEVAMAQSQLKKSEENIKKLRKALGKKEKDIPAWMQAKITDTAHDTDAAAGYVDKMDEQYMTQQQRAEHMARKMVNQAKGVAARYDAAKKAAQNVKTTSGSVTVRAEEVIAEKRDGKSAKDKGYSLRDWFKGGGWVQAGGKYDGKPCAKQPGQKTKPFCRDADDRASMSKDERERRAKKKRKEDPNPNREGKAKMVSEQSGGGYMQVGDKTVNIGNPRYHHPDSSTYRPPSLPRPTTGSVPPPATLRSNTPTTRRTPTRTAAQSRAQSNSGAITSTNNSRLRQAQRDAADVGRVTGTSGLMRSVTQSSNSMQSRYDQLRNAMRQAGMKGADQNMNMRGVPMRNSYEPEGKVVEGYDDGDVIRPTDRIRMKDGKLRTLKDIDAKLKDKGTKKEEVELVDEKFAAQGSLSYGSTPGKATDKSVSSAVDKAIANKGTAASTASEEGKTGVTASGSVSYSGRIKTDSDSTKSKRKFDKPNKPKKKPKPTRPGKPKPTNNKPKPTSDGPKPMPTRTNNRPTGGESKPTGGILMKSSYQPESELVDEGKKDACYHKVKSRYSVWPSAYASGALVKCRKVGAANWGNKTKKEGFSDWREDMLLEGLEDKLRQMSPEQIEDLIKANKGAEQKIRDALKNLKTPKSQGPGVQLPNVPKQPASTSSATPRETYKKGGSDRVSYQRRPRPARPSAPKPKVGLGGKVLRTLSKIKNPRVAAMLGLGALSAGMLYKGTQGIRKQMRDYKEKGYNQTGYDYIMKGQQNEGYDVSNWKDDFQATEYETVDIIKPEPLQPTQSVIDEAGKKCWKGYKKAGTQKLFGKTYNRCVKAHFSDWRADMDLQEKKAKKDYDGDGKIETGEEEYKGSRDKAIKKAIAMKEDWQKSNRKDGVDGMSQKSVDAYKRENPGSKLQTAVTEKKPTGKRAKRRTSFCARSKGQKDMHNIDCTKTPEKKICKARKRWRC